MKKFFLISMVLTFVTMYANAFGTNDFTSGNLGYRIASVDQRSVYVSEALYDAQGVYVIPSEVEYNGIKFSVDCIDYLAFNGGWIKSVTIPSTIEKIIDCGFYSTEKGIETLIIEDSPEILDCTWLHGVNDYDGGQFSRTIAKRVYLGRNLTYVPWERYYRDYSPFYTVITIEDFEAGQYITDLSFIRFDLCTNLKNITLHSTEPPKVGAFSNLQYINTHVTVPKGTLNKYKSASVWSSFINLKESEENTSKITFDYDSNLGSVYVDRQPIDKEIIVDNGTNIEVLLLPAIGNIIGAVYVNGENKTSELTNNTLILNNITENATIKVVFSAPQRNIKMLCGTQGSYSINVDDGSFLDIVIEEESGWKIKSVLVNNVDKTSELSNNHILLSKITTDITISAVFEESSSGVNNIISSSLNNYDIRLSGKNIIFIGADNTTKEVFDTSGKLLYKGVDNKFACKESGIYIVSINGKRFKISL